MRQPGQGRELLHICSTREVCAWVTLAPADPLVVTLMTGGPADHGAKSDNHYAES